MSHHYAAGWEYFSPDLGTVETCQCRVCGADCEVRRDCRGPRSSIEAMGRSRDYWDDKPPTHDSFWCPHAARGWHRQALKLLMKRGESPSAVLRKILTEEIELILRLKQPTLPEDYRDEQDGNEDEA